VEVVEVVDEEEVVEVVLEPEYVDELKVSTYWVIEVAAWVPGALNSPTANPISTVDPTFRAEVGSWGEAFFSAKGR
jgi:hypothetical protein